MINQRQLLIVAAIVGTVLVMIIGAVLAFTTNRTPENITDAQLQIEVAPKGSEIKINGKSVDAGTHDIQNTPTTLRVTASRKGFAPQVQTITIQRGENRYVGFALVSNSPDTAKWYEEHEIDNQIASQINSNIYSQNTVDIASANPLLEQLPYLGEGLRFRVDYGQHQRPGPPAENMYILISAGTPEDRQAALDWIQSQGFSLADLEIQFADFSNPLNPTTGSTE